MKRYIEIVYDNSGSMNNRIGNKRKFEIAQELFEKEILTTTDDQHPPWGSIAQKEWHNGIYVAILQKN